MSEVTQLEFGDEDGFDGLIDANVDIQAVDNGFIIRTRYGDDSGHDEVAVTLKDVLEIVKANLSR